MNLQHVIIRCPELTELKLPNAKVLSSNEFPPNSYMIHIPERLYFQYKDYAHLTVYVKPRDSYFHLENFMPNIIIREGVGSSYEQVQGKSNRIRVERLKEINIHDESVHDETSNTPISSILNNKHTHEDKTKDKPLSSGELDVFNNTSMDLSRDEKLFNFNFPHITGGECFKYTIFISKAIPHHEHLSKLFKEDGHLVIEFSGKDISKRKTDQYHTMMVLTFDELDYWWNRENIVLYYIISKPGTVYPFPFYYPCLEYEESKDEEHYIKYGTNAKSIYYFKGKTLEKAYDWFYHSNCGLFNSTNLDPTYGQLLECVSWLYLYRWKRLNMALSEITNRNKKEVRSIDIKPIAFGMYNATYDISTVEASSILRIAFNSTDFDDNACRILMRLKDSGFVPVHYYNSKLRYSVLAKCNQILDFNVDKFHAMMDKIRSTIQAEPSLCISDFHKGNVMELNDDYVYIDIDLNGIDAKKIMKAYGSKTIDDIMDEELPTDSYVKPYTVPILKTCSIPITNHTISLCALELAYISDCSGKLKYTSEVHSMICSRLKEDVANKPIRGGSCMKLLDKALDLSVHKNSPLNNPQGIIVDDQVPAQMSITCSGNKISASDQDETQWNLDEGPGNEKFIPELSSNADEHVPCLNLDRSKILASNSSSTSSSISVESSDEINGGNKSRFKYVKIRSRPYLIIYFHGMNPHGIKFHRSITETIRLYCQSAEYSFGYYLRGKENELTDQDIDRIELKPLYTLNDNEKASISKQSQVKLNTIAYNDVFDLDREFKLFDKALHDEFKDLLKLKNLKIYFLGHGYGACFSKYFAMKLNAKLDVTSISLDGSDLYNAVPLLMNEYINGEYVKDTDEVKIKPEDIKFGPKEIIYEGVNYYGNSEAGLYEPYCDVMYKLKDDYDKHIIIDYCANPKDPNNPKLIELKSKYYKNYHELRYGRVHSHTVHMHYACVQAIFNQFIERNWCLYRGILDDVRDKRQDQIHYIIKRMNGDDLTIIIQGGCPSQTIKWNDIKYYTLALFEQKNTFYPCYFYLEYNPCPSHTDVLDHLRPSHTDVLDHPWFPYTWDYWSRNRDLLQGIFKTNDDQAKSIKAFLNDCPKCPRLIDFKPCDYRNSALRNPIFRWLLITLDPNLLENHMSGNDKIPNSYSTSIDELKASGFYNEKLSDDIYKRLIHDWSWKDANGLIKLRHKLLNMNLLDIFNLVMFNFSSYEDGKPLGNETIYPICFEVKTFFHSRFPRSSNFITDIFNDLPILNELSNEITHGDHKLVVIYGGSGHMRTYMKFMSLYYDQNCDADVNQAIIDDYLREDLGKK